MSCGKVALLYSRSRSQWRFWTSVNVCPDNTSDQSDLVWWCIIISQSIIQKYHFAMFKVKATIVSTRSSEILKLLQSKLVWWYIITRQCKTPWKDFLAFTQGARQRIRLGGLWTRLMPLLAVPISKAGVSTGSNQENVERTLILSWIYMFVKFFGRWFKCVIFISFCTCDDIYIICETDY